MPATGHASSIATTTAAGAPRVIFPDGFVVSTEIAADDPSRAQGLMFRDQLRPGTGMLFIFPRMGEYPFWMKDTLIPLDMIWIDESKKIVAMHQNVPPCKTEICPNYPPKAPSRYVLEVAGGVAKEHNLKVGDVLRFENTDSIAAR
ncbi:MAG TPA: DUF192 domain-containing protein [Thermoanaerobaculia bacterium]